MALLSKKSTKMLAIELERIYCRETSADLDLALPESGILKNYIEYSSESTDAPEHYHIFGGISTVSAVVGRRVYFHGYGGKNLYLNTWVVILAPSSLYRKSTVLGIAKSILYSVQPSLVSPSEFTPEGFLSHLKENPQSVIFWSEFAGILSQMERNYMLGSKELLTELYDCPDIYERKLKAGVIKVEKPYVSIFAGSTLDWLNSKLKEGDIRGGFLNRFIPVPPGKKSKTYAFPPQPNNALRTQLVAELTELQQISGPADFTMVRPEYEKWYINYEQGLGNLRNVQNLSGFLTRLTEYTLKFAIIFQLGENKGLTISSENLERAILLTEYLKRNIVSLVNEELSFTPAARERKKLLELIPAEPGHINRSVLTKYSGLKAKDVDAHMEILLQTEPIKEGYMGDGKKRTKVYYKINSENSDHFRTG